jgi:hypothetical protein
MVCTYGDGVRKCVQRVKLLRRDDAEQLLAKAQLQDSAAVFRRHLSIDTLSTNVERIAAAYESAAEVAPLEERALLLAHEDNEPASVSGCDFELPVGAIQSAPQLQAAENQTKRD